MIKRLRKVKKVRDLVPDSVVEKAANLNPLATKSDTPPPIESVPRITNETIAEHREEVLSGARKYIYPLQHSKHRIIMITSTIVTGAILGLLVYCLMGLYKFYQYNTFLYRITQVVPFPIARINHSFVNYENYLFELRHYVHYYQTQLQRDLNGNDKQQLILQRKQSLEAVINNAYIKILADRNHVSVSDKEVDARINDARNQNRLGSSNKVFADVLRDYLGWSISDFKRSLRQEILSEKVEARLDNASRGRAADALSHLKSGANFSEIAKQVSDDPITKNNGGDYGFGITKTNPNVPPEVVDVLFKLAPGQISGVILASRLEINRPDTLEILKVTQTDGNTVTAQHISFYLKDISTYVDSLKKKEPPRAYVKF